MSVDLFELVAKIDELLQAVVFRDYCPNGLQVEGRPVVKKLISGVTASQALIDEAVVQGADAVLVHHGYFWKGEDPCITGMKQRRLKRLLDSGISLLAYHLPLDAHEQLGNNAQLANKLDIRVTGPLDSAEKYPVGNVGQLAEPMPIAVFAALIEERLGRKPFIESVRNTPVQKVAWCTGAAQGYIEKAAQLGADLYLTGEVSEPTIHFARENNIDFISAGHHATERYGVQALGGRLAELFCIEHVFVDCPNPI